MKKQNNLEYVETHSLLRQNFSMYSFSSCVSNFTVRSVLTLEQMKCYKVFVSVLQAAADVWSQVFLKHVPNVSVSIADSDFFDEDPLAKFKVDGTIH